MRAFARMLTGAAFVLGVAGCATHSISPEQAARFKRVGVISLAAYEFDRQYVGVMVFGNEREVKDISAWDVDAAYEEQIAVAVESISSAKAVRAPYAKAEFAHLNDLSGPVDHPLFWDPKLGSGARNRESPLRSEHPGRDHLRDEGARSRFHRRLQSKGRWRRDIFARQDQQALPPGPDGSVRLWDRETFDSAPPVRLLRYPLREEASHAGPAGESRSKTGLAMDGRGRRTPPQRVDRTAGSRLAGIAQGFFPGAQMSCSAQCRGDDDRQ